MPYGDNPLLVLAVSEIMGDAVVRLILQLDEEASAYCAAGAGVQHEVALLAIIFDGDAS